MAKDIAEIKGLSHEGRGLAFIEGKTVFIEGALTHEIVQFVYKNRRPRFDEGVSVHVQKPSEDRVEPKCAYFNECGGCSLQHLKNDSQILFKQTVVLEQLQHFGNVSPQHILQPLKGFPFGYRRKARLSVKFVSKKEKVLVGFREKRGRFVADIDDCAILHPKIGGLLSILKKMILTLDVFKNIPQIEVAMGDEDIALVFRHMSALSKKDEETLSVFGHTHQVHIYLQPEGPKSVYKLWPLEGEERLRYRLDAFNIQFKFHPLDFTQINSEINQQMVAKAIELLDPKPSERVLDLFCGLGNFTLPLAQFAAEVVGVEGSLSMVERAIENACFNHVNNVEFFVEDLQKESYKEAPFASKKFDKILLDPPRGGAFELMSFIGNSTASKVVYVSCNPSTLARDLGELVNKYGFRLISLGVMDMFPHTSHVESIALLERVNGKSSR